jgi:hypothetical protein
LIEFVDIRENDDGAQRFRQKFDKTKDAFARLTLLYFFLTRGNYGGRWFWGDFFQAQIGGFSLLTKKIPADVMGNPKDPGLQPGSIPDVFKVIVDFEKSFLDQVIRHPFVSHRMQNEFPDPLVIKIVNLREMHGSNLVSSGTAIRTAIVAGQGANIPFLTRKVSDAVLHQHIDIILDFVSAFHCFLNIPGIYSRGLGFPIIKFEAGYAIRRRSRAQANQQLGFLVHGFSPPGDISI